MKLSINSKSLHLRLSPEVMELLKTTGEPTGYIRDLIHNSFGITEQDIKASRKAIDNSSEKGQV